jgi:L-lysine exporter family protein LysE/ArgO
MTAGVLGVGGALAAAPRLATALTLAGCLFLLAYGARALWRAGRPGALVAAADQAAAPRQAVLAQAAAFTLLNPHVYLDTVLLVGTMGAQYPGAQRAAFLAGACAASGLWFTALGYGARRLAPWFARPAAWRALDAAVGVTMLVLAAWLAQSLWRPGPHG